MDIGGNIPEEVTLTEFDGPMGDKTFDLNAGFQFDISGGYRIMPWLEVGPEFGFLINGVDSIGDWSTSDAVLFQVLMMANVRVEYPTQGRLVPFAGAGIGGSASFLSFGGGGGYYYYYEPLGDAADCVLAWQGFAGVEYRLSDNTRLGLEYRYLSTNPQHWDVDWWTGADFEVGVDNIRIHTICLVFSGSF